MGGTNGEEIQSERIFEGRLIYAEAASHYKKPRQMQAPQLNKRSSSYTEKRTKMSLQKFTQFRGRFHNS